MQQLMNRAPSVLPIVALLLAMVSFQAGASIAKSMFPLVGPIGMVTIRIVVGTAILAITMRPWRVRIAPTSRTALVVYGISLGVMNLCFYVALSRIPLGIAVALEFSGPLAVAVLTSRRALDLCWAALAAAGMLLILPIAHRSGGIDAVGVLYALAAGTCWAIYILAGRKAGADHGARSVALGTVISTLVVAPIGIATAGSALLSRAVVLPGLAVGILSTALPYTLEMMALTRIPARTYGILMSVEPAVAALIALMYLHERLSGVQWIAIALVVGASAGTTVTVQQKVPIPS
jgi:inner membrane transporter RhtA